MKIIFLGTNGWYDSATGSTPSILIKTINENIILDAGYGIAKAKKLVDYSKPTYLFITHLHLDHICGLHCLPLFKFKELVIFGHVKIKKYLKKIVAHPFMADFKYLTYKVKVVLLKEGRHKFPFEFECLKLKHVDMTLGYRLKIENKVVVYSSDTEVCENDLQLSKDADVLIHECAFLPGTESTWGHTTPEQAGKLAAESNCKQMVLTHFGPDGYDTMDKRKEAEKIAKKHFNQSIAAFDGMELDLN